MTFMENSLSEVAVSKLYDQGIGRLMIGYNPRPMRWHDRKPQKNDVVRVLRTPEMKVEVVRFDNHLYYRVRSAGGSIRCPDCKKRPDRGTYGVVIDGVQLWCNYHSKTRGLWFEPEGGIHDAPIHERRPHKDSKRLVEFSERMDRLGAVEASPVA